jgi:hypothetical protein
VTASRWVRAAGFSTGEFEFVEHLDGVDWHDAPSPRWWELWHRHEPQSRGQLSTVYVERCRCGATRIDRADPWIND